MKIGFTFNTSYVAMETCQNMYPKTVFRNYYLFFHKLEIYAFKKI